MGDNFINDFVGRLGMHVLRTSSDMGGKKYIVESTQRIGSERWLKFKRIEAGKNVALLQPRNQRFRFDQGTARHIDQHRARPQSRQFRRPQSMTCIWRKTTMERNNFGGQHLREGDLTSTGGMNLFHSRMRGKYRNTGSHRQETLRKGLSIGAPANQSNMRPFKVSRFSSAWHRNQNTSLAPCP